MKRWFVLLLGLFVTQTNLASAQGVLVFTNHRAPLPRPISPGTPKFPAPTPTVSYKIKELAVQARLADQVARVQVTQSFVNTGSQPMEVQFLFPLPYDGAIDKLTLLVDGKEFPGKLMPAREARSVYEAIVRSNKDPALLEWIGMGLFQTSVFPVPPGAERQVVLNYNQLLRKERGLTDFLFPLSTARYTSHFVEKIDFRITLESGIDIKNVYSPTHAVDVKRPDARHAVVSYARTNEIPTSDFRLLFDVDKQQIGASVLSYKPRDGEDGFFLLLASPQVKAANADRIKKTVLFVVDRSGSMNGKKIEQAKSALKFVLNNLREGDLFNIIAYESSVESFKPELVRYNEESRKLALGYVEGIYPGGGTNIHGALTSALRQLKDNRQPNYVLFLTDGLPTVGVTDEGRIANSAKEENKARARILSFGVGYDVNSRLLDRISRDGFGLSEYVRPDEDIEAHVSKVYSNISAPVLTNVELNLEVDEQKIEDGKLINRVYPKGLFDLFEGQQLVVVGRYKKPGAAKVVIKGYVDGAEQKFDFGANLTAKSDDESYAFVEKLWAMRRVGEIIDQLDLNGQNKEMVKELVELSTKHGILTPYTSFLADETLRPLANADALKRTQLGLGVLSEASGISGVAQRGEKGRLQNAQIANGPAKAPLNEARGMSSLASNSFRDAKTDKEVAADSVRQYGNQTVYARKLEGRVVAETETTRRRPAEPSIVFTPETASLDLEKDKANIEVVDRFTEPYFALIQANTAAENQILSQQRPEEQLLIKLRGKNYLLR